MIILQTLRWSNCFSYGSNNELNLEGTTVTQIIGTNGMGKSSIPLIVEEVLYNKNSKGIKKADIPNRYINDGYSIYLSFIKNNNEYEIEVKRKSTLKFSFNFSREIEVCQNNVNKSDNFSREIEVCQLMQTKVTIFLVKLKSVKIMQTKVSISS